MTEEELRWLIRRNQKGEAAQAYALGRKDMAIELSKSSEKLFPKKKAKRNE